MPLKNIIHSSILCALVLTYKSVMKKRTERILRSNLGKLFAEKNLSLKSFDQFKIDDEQKEKILGHNEFLNHLIDVRTLSEVRGFLGHPRIQARLHFDQIAVTKLMSKGDDWRRAVEASMGVSFLKKTS